MPPEKNASWLITKNSKPLKYLHRSCLCCGTDMVEDLAMAAFIGKHRPCKNGYKPLANIGGPHST